MDADNYDQLIDVNKYCGISANRHGCDYDT